MKMNNLEVLSEIILAFKEVDGVREICNIADGEVEDEEASYTEHINGTKEENGS